MTAPRLARAGAILIALLAAIDPVWTRTRVVPVPIAIAHDGQSAAFAGTITRDLAGEFDAGVSAAAPEATILVRAPGHPLPSMPETGRIFIVDDPSRAAAIRIRSFDVPEIALAGRTLAATVVVDVVASTGDVLTIELRAGGRLVAREERAAADRGPIELTMRFVPPQSGLLPLDVEVTSGRQTARTGAAVRVEERPLHVLFVDPQPSWSSTFVRRALEQDPAFEVSSSTVTSRGVTATSGSPARYDDPEARETIDAIVASTPSALPAQTLAALESFARERGGAVIFLGDANAGRRLARLSGVSAWQRRTLGDPATAESRHGTFQLTEALLPSSMPVGAVALAAAGTSAPIVQDIPIGRGRLIVSGALDAWRYRGAPDSAFAAFWRGVIGDAALAAAPPLAVTVSPQRVNPGATVAAEVIVRDAAGGPVTAEGSLAFDGREQPVRLWPTAAAGVFTARLDTPAANRVATLKVAATVDGATLRTEAPLLVSASAPLANTSSAVPQTLASTRGGAYVADGNVDALRAALRAAYPAHRAPETAHPMRYVWWLAPFTALLGYEWRWRRQHGLK